MKLYSAGTSPPWEVWIAVAAGGSASDSASDGKRTKGERTVRARLLVATDGAKSRVRDLCGLKTWGWDYRQRAVVGTVKVEGPHTTAWQRFLPRGPVALLPLWDGYSSFVWSTTPSQARELTEELTEAEFVDRLNDALRSDPDLRLVTGEFVIGWRARSSPVFGSFSFTFSCCGSPLAFGMKDNAPVWFSDEGVLYRNGGTLQKLHVEFFVSAFLPEYGPSFENVFSYTHLCRESVCGWLSN
ncbi:unnamed protein product [Phaeothamnion confervicola]